MRTMVDTKVDLDFTYIYIIYTCDVYVEGEIPLVVMLAKIYL